MVIYLIGLPGSGKTTIGIELARYLNFAFVDTDEEIVKEQGKSVESIFRTEGETFFRRLEQQSLLNQSLKSQVVVSTGGGMPCFFDNMEVINKTGFSIFLDVPLDNLSARLSNGKNKNRPLVKGKSKEALTEFLKEKYTERLPYYSKAKMKVKGGDISYKDIVVVLQQMNLI